MLDVSNVSVEIKDVLYQHNEKIKSVKEELERVKAVNKETNAVIKEIESKVNIDEKFYKDEEVDYNIGDYVYHDVFGQGKVVDIQGSLISIAFKHPYGIKKLMKNHKSITKIV